MGASRRSGLSQLPRCLRGGLERIGEPRAFTWSGEADGAPQMGRRPTTAGRTLATGRQHVTRRAVLELPPSDSCRMRVSFELRYGTCGLDSESAPMTRQSDESDALIFLASSSVSPLEPVLPT